MAAYYNEIDPFAAQWLQNLIAAGHIAPGDVDQRSITEVKPDDLKGYTQCHFFAGIGGWSIALRLAGWPDDRPVWTGSCPCQPFSSAGKGNAQSDERHLWPNWFRLISEHHPSIVFGEQVAGAIAKGWFDDVFFDLEAENYACAAAVLPACSVQAPHERNRIWFVANTESAREWRGKSYVHEAHGGQVGECLQQFNGTIKSDVSDPNRERLQGGFEWDGSASIGRIEEKGRIEVLCSSIDWKNDFPAPKLCSVDDGILCRTSKLRAYGNAIVPQVAAEFIKAAM